MLCQTQISRCFSPGHVLHPQRPPQLRQAMSSITKEPPTFTLASALHNRTTLGHKNRWLCARLERKERLLSLLEIHFTSGHPVVRFALYLFAGFVVARFNTWCAGVHMTSKHCLIVAKDPRMEGRLLKRTMPISKQKWE